MTKPGTLACEVCKQIIEYLEELLIAGWAKDELDALAQEVCQTLPAPLSSLCLTFLDQYIDDIVQWLDDGITSLDICKRLGFCETSKPALSSRPPRFPKAVHMTCDFCQASVAHVRGRPDGQAELIRLCGRFDNPLRIACLGVASHAAARIESFLARGLDELAACQTVGLCGAKAQRLRPARRAGTGPGGQVCDVCTQLVGKIAQLILEGEVEEVIIEIVNEYCQELPVPLSSLCIEFADQYIDEIIQYILAGFNPEEVCAFFNLCAAPPPSAARAARKFMRPQSSGDVLCDVAQDLVDLVRQLINKGDVDVAHAALMMCRDLPIPTSAVCTGFAETYSQEIVRQIGNGGDSFEVCTRIGVCSESSIRRKAKTFRIN
jgi:saposin